MMRAHARLALGAIVTCVSVTALAQTTGVSADSGRIEEIVVTAERRAASVQDTPIAVSALTAESLDRLGIENTVDIDRAVPNLYILEATANPSTLSVALRGSAEQAGGLAVAEASVGVYVDDVYRGRPAGSNLEFTDIERIEVLRGPQGTLYGRNTIAGAIKIVTRKPGADPYVNASLGYGRFDEMIAKGAVGGPVSDSVGASLALLYRDVDGYFFNIARDEGAGNRQNLAGRIVVNLYGNERLDATATLFGARDRNDGYVAPPGAFPALTGVRTSQITFPAGGIYRTQSPTASRGETDQWALTLDLGYDLGPARLRSISGYIDIDDFFRTDFTGGVRTPAGFAAGFDRTSNGGYRQFSQELQLLGEGERLDWLVGAYYFNERNDQVFNDRLGAFALLPTTFDLKTDSYALFANGTYRLSDRLSVTAGLRWSQDHKRMAATIQSGFVPPIALVPVELDEKFSSLSPRVGVEFKPNNDTLLYVSAARGFKAGGFNALAVANPAVLRIPFDEMTVWSYETGVKLDALDRRLRINAAAFYADYDDIQQTSRIPGVFSFAVQNVGTARVYGLELEAQAIPADGLTIYGQLGLQHDEYGRLNPGSTAALNNARRLPVTPRTSGQVGFSYEAPARGGLRMLAGSDLAYEGSYFAAVDNTLKIDSYWRWNGYVGLGIGENWEVRLSARNLTDDKTVVCCSATSAGLIVLPPRTWLAELRYRM